MTEPTDKYLAVCHCGTCQEAREAAEKLLVQLTSADCPVWAFQIACTLRALCTEQLVAKGSSRPMLGELANTLVQLVRENSSTEGLQAQIEAKKQDLYH
jgi:hypothetical protein